MPKQIRFEDWVKEAKKRTKKKKKLPEGTDYSDYSGLIMSETLKGAARDAKKAAHAVGKVARKAGKAVGKAGSIAGDTLKMAGQEIASGKARQRIFIDPSKDIWETVTKQAKKYARDALAWSRKKSKQLDEATPIVNPADIITPNVGSKKKALEDRLAEEEAEGIHRAINEKKKKK